MKADIRDITLLLIGMTADLCSSARHSYTLPSCNAIIRSPSPTDSCKYLCMDGYGNMQYGDHKNGMICRLNWGSGNYGKCFNGICQVPWYYRPGKCDNVYRKGGYASTCNFTCSEGYGPRIVAYRDRTPCVTLNQRGKPIGGAGLCQNGVCRQGYDLSLHEEKEAHPSKLKSCNDKENYSRMVLDSCYHYCNIMNRWYYGYYNSNYSSSCHLPAPAAPNQLGWCCNGDCITQALCGLNSVE